MYSNAPYSDRDPRHSYAMQDRSNSQQQYYDDAGDDGYPAYPVRFSRYQLGNVAPGARYNYNPAEYAHDTSYQQHPDQLDPPSSARNSLVMQDMDRRNNPNNPYSANDFDAASSTATFVEKSPALSGAAWKMDGNDGEKKRQQNKLGGAWPAPAEGLLANDHSNRGNNNDEYDDDDDHQIGMNWKRPNRKVLYTIIGIVALLACGGIAGIAIGIVKATKGTTVASVQSAVNSVFMVPTATPTSATGTDASASSSTGTGDRANTRKSSSASTAATAMSTTATSQRTSLNVGAEESTTQATSQTTAATAAASTGQTQDTANTSRVVDVAATAAATSDST